MLGVPLGAPFGVDRCVDGAFTGVNPCLRANCAQALRSGLSLTQVRRFVRWVERGWRDEPNVSSR